MKPKKTLCWKCKKARGGEMGCGWFNGFNKIKGWRIKKNSQGILILECPEFVRDKLHINTPILEIDAGYKKIKFEDLEKILGRSKRTVSRYISNGDIDVKLRRKGYELCTDKDVYGHNKYYIKEIKQ